MTSSTCKTIVWLTIFSIAMAYLETAVVVYLRELYYPGGFKFPLTPIGYNIALTEFWREAATIVMLLGAGIVAGKNLAQRFAFFIFCFAIWDIFYYVFLKLLLDWPQSLMTWDILFLIPVPWVGPVITPVIVSLTMIFLAVSVVYFNDKRSNVKINSKEWILLSTGALIIVISFIWDYCLYVLQQHPFSSLWSLSSGDLFEVSKNYIPESFKWPVFFAGEILCLSAVYLFNRKMIRSQVINLE